MFRCIVASAAGMATLAPLEDGERGAIVNTSRLGGRDRRANRPVGLYVIESRHRRTDAGGGARSVERGHSANTILPGIFAAPTTAWAPEAGRKAALAAQVPFPKRSATRRNMPIWRTR